MIVSHLHYMWFITLAIFLSSVVWLVVDAVRLARAWPEGKDAHDRIFGSIIGLIVALVGIGGVLKFHLG